MREVLNRLGRDPLGQFDPERRIYFREMYDHLVRIDDIVEGIVGSLGDPISGALDTSPSVVPDRTIDIMSAGVAVNLRDCLWGT
jgi:magnesium transporter